MMSWNSGSLQLRTSACPRLRWKEMPMGHRIQRPVPLPGNSRAAMNTASSRAVSGTICRKKHLGTLPRRSSMSTRTRRRHRSRARLASCSLTRPICHLPTQRRTVMETQTNQTTATAVRPFRVDMSEEAIADMRRRIAATRFPDKELVADASQGVQLAMLQELARYWATDYDFRRLAERLNALPQFMTKIDGIDIHFIHVKSRHEHALPLIITHGWPGSVIEMLEVVGPLTDPTAHGGRAEDAFDLGLPSIPG